MKFATIPLLGILLLGSFASLNAQPAGTSQVTMAYVNEKFDPPPPTPTGFDGVCLIYYTLLGDFDRKSLFWTPLFGTPVVDAKHARFIWVSDYTVQTLTENEGLSSFLIPEGTGTIYYAEYPLDRNWTDRSTWGDPIATFVRKAGVFQSRDGGISGTLMNTAQLVSSTPFTLNGKTYNLKDLVPQGMTCFETAVDVYEAGTCVAIGK
ncbi:MAG: hypothetical protein LAQ69_14785 [Acidobacteriia bacterium]|nr:hypothetical protein [Terriglobia bacterium]